MAVVQVIENGGARLEVNVSGNFAELAISGGTGIDLDAEDLKALIKRCKVVLAQIEG